MQVVAPPGICRRMAFRLVYPKDCLRISDPNHRMWDNQTHLDNERPKGCHSSITHVYRRARHSERIYLPVPGRFGDLIPLDTTITAAAFAGGPLHAPHEQRLLALGEEIFRRFSGRVGKKGEEDEGPENGDCPSDEIPGKLHLSA